MTQSAARLLTQAEYARSRKARGLSGGTRQAVKKAVDDGRITAFGPDKKIDQQLADAQWDRNSRARVAVGDLPADVAGPAAAGDLVDSAGGGAPAPAAPASPASDAGGQLHSDPGYLRSRADQAAADARISQMKADEMAGSLVRVDQVRAELASRLAPVRESLLQFPARMAAQLAAEVDPARIQTLLEAELHQILAPLGKRDAQVESESPAC